MINNSLATHSKISITKMPRLTKRGKKSPSCHFLAISRVFFAARRFQNRILSFSASLYIVIERVFEQQMMGITMGEYGDIRGI